METRECASKLTRRKKQEDNKCEDDRWALTTLAQNMRPPPLAASARACTGTCTTISRRISATDVLNSKPRTAAKMHQSARLHKESRVCAPVTGFNTNAQCQAVHCNAAQMLQQ